jgi:hypothetical protein
MPETIPSPAGVPASVLAKADKNPTLKTLVDAWDPETSSTGPVELTYREATALRRDLFPALDPRHGQMNGQKMHFPFPGAGDWRLVLIYRGIYHRIHTVAAFLDGPSQSSS